MKTLFTYLPVWLLMVLTTTFVGCSNTTTPSDLHSKPIAHVQWDSLLKQHVNHLGQVDYKGFASDSLALAQYLTLLSENAPNQEHWSTEEQLAYWINAYNAFTVKLIVDHYPVKSIRDLGPTLDIPAVNTVWHKEFFTIGGAPFSLDAMEHRVLRKQFQEPRIHFAIVCASISCPSLRNEAYVADKLDQQLNDQAIHFINNPEKNKLSANKIEISRIFTWFKNDFISDGSIISYLNQYTQKPINPDADIEYMDYNWALNE